MHTKVHINLKKEVDDSYDIVIGTSLASAARDIKKILLADRYFVVTDSNVERLYGKKFLRLIKEYDPSPALVSVPPGEASKSRTTKGMLEDRLLALGVSRSSAVIALGGGMVGDLAGFVAATLFRGIPFIQVPTTLLAQVDSSIGGKVALNHPRGKNLVGAFYQPKKVYIDVGTLRTLPADEFANGLAEVVKYGAIIDRNFFSFLESNRRRILSRDEACLTTVIRRCCVLKKGIVEIDERETNYRRVLNFGHTIGHSLETLTGSRLSHGKAVAIGMVAEATISAGLDLLQAGEVTRLKNLLNFFNLPTAIPGSIDFTKLLATTLQDKKMHKGIVQYTLLKEIGTAQIGVGVPQKKVQQILTR